MTQKITQKITGYQVKSNDATPEQPSTAVDTMHEGIVRPEALKGSTYKVKTPDSDHALYITINDLVLNTGTEHEEHRPYEIFINSKNMEHYQWVVALTRLISAVFRKGGDVAFLVDELMAVFDPRGGYWEKGGVFVPSLVAKIGMVIKNHLMLIGQMAVDDSLILAARAMVAEKAEGYDASSLENAVLCGKCHVKAVVMRDGCATCLSCGESKCG